MGNTNLMREEACVMRKRSERSLVLFSMIFVFACLLLSGGSRLIGALIFPMGIILTTLAGADVFMGNALISMPVLAAR